MTAKVERRISAWVPEDFIIKSGWVTDVRDVQHRVTWEDADDSEEAETWAWGPFLRRASAIVGIITVGVFLTLLGYALVNGVYTHIITCGPLFNLPSSSPTP